MLLLNTELLTIKVDPWANTAPPWYAWFCSNMESLTITIPLFSVSRYPTEVIAPPQRP